MLMGWGIGMMEGVASETRLAAYSYGSVDYTHR